MADHLTQLQNSLDQLATQMYASLYYVSNYHASAPIPGQPDVRSSVADNRHDRADNVPDTIHPSISTPPTVNGGSAPQPLPQPDQSQAQPQHQDPSAPPRPDTPRTFSATLSELARDLVTREQQIEALIASLPGIRSSRADQEARMKELDAELRGVDLEIEEAVRVREGLVRRVERVIAGVRRV